jgi:hypothetical protein
MGFGCRLAGSSVHRMRCRTEQNEDFGNALISVAASRNQILSLAWPSQSSDIECTMILDNAMLAWKDVKKK